MRTAIGATEDWVAGPRHEAQVQRILAVELPVLLGRLATHLDAFAAIVEETMSPHPSGCWVAFMGNPVVRQHWRSVVNASDDAASHLYETVNSWGYVWPILDQVLPKARQVHRLSRPNGLVIPRRSHNMWEILGWLTPPELALHKRLRFAGEHPMVLEKREDVESMRNPMLRVPRGDGGFDVHPITNMRPPDSHTSQYYPILIRPEMDLYELAISNANVARMRILAAAVRKWKPERAVRRALDPNCGELVNLTARVVNFKPLLPVQPAPPQKERPALKPDGWTRGELVAQAQERSSLSATKFDSIRKAAGIEPGERGGRGQQRRFSNAELRALIQTVTANRFRNGQKIAAAWRELLGD